MLTAAGVSLLPYFLFVKALNSGGSLGGGTDSSLPTILTLLVFSVFSLTYLKEPISWNHLVGFALISAGAFFIFQKW